jgi:Cu/Zn superoxide dismutase
LIAIATLLLMAAACGSAGTGSTPSPSPSAATPSASSAPALAFKLSGIGTKAAGTISVTTQSGSMTIELKITGLQANSSHVSHIHVGKCSARGAIKFALNQVVADGQGDADIKTTLKAAYPPASGTWYVVVHAGPDMQGTNSQYLLCGNIFK